VIVIDGGGEARQDVWELAAGAISPFPSMAVTVGRSMVHVGNRLLPIFSLALLLV